MAGHVRVFIKEDDLLREVHPSMAEGKQTFGMHLPIVVIMTDEECKAREAEEREAEVAKHAARAKGQKRTARRQEIAGRLGLTAEELGDLLK